MYTYNELNPMTESSNSATAGAMDVMRCDAGNCTPGPDEACVHDVYLAMRKTYGLDVTLHPSMRLSVCRFAAAMFLQCIGFRIYMRVLWGKPSNPSLVSLRAAHRLSVARSVPIVVHLVPYTARASI
jgi:hypothetical protein